MAYQSELEKLQRRYEEKPSQWFAALAEEHRRAGDVQLAIEILRQGLEQRSNYVSGHIVLARCLVDRGEEEEAQQVLERVLELDAENIIALKVLSEIVERRGDAAAARSWLERLLEVDPMNEEGQQMLERLAEAAELGGAEGAVEEPIEGTEAVDAGEAFEAEKDAPVAEEPSAPVESTVQEPAPEELASTPVDGLEVIEDALEPAEEGVVGASTDEVIDADGLVLDRVPDHAIEVESSPRDESVADMTRATVEKDTPLELRPDASDHPPPEGIVGAEVDRPEPIELTGGPGMVVDDDQAAELAGSGAASPEALDSGDRSARDTEQPPEPIPAEGTPASATKEPQGAPGQDPEPVVTATMAEVYVTQGLVDQALKVYRVLLARRPADAELQERIAELESQTAPAAVASEGPRYRGSETGGTSTRTFLAQVLAAGAGEEALAEPPPLPPPLPLSAPEEPTPLDTAFSAPEDASEMPGAPTQPAPDGASLASVFGDEPPPPPPSPSPSPSPEPGEQGAKSKKGGGVSYDQFFGGSGANKAPPQENASSDEGEPPDAESADFKDWLKGLKS